MARFFFPNHFKRQLHMTNVVVVVMNSAAVLPRRAFEEVDQPVTLDLCKIILPMARFLQVFQRHSSFCHQYL